MSCQLLWYVAVFYKDREQPHPHPRVTVRVGGPLLDTAGRWWPSSASWTHRAPSVPRGTQAGHSQLQEWQCPGASRVRGVLGGPKQFCILCGLQCSTTRAETSPGETEFVRGATSSSLQPLGSAVGVDRERHRDPGVQQEGQRRQGWSLFLPFLLLKSVAERRSSEPCNRGWTF